MKQHENKSNTERVQREKNAPREKCNTKNV